MVDDRTNKNLTELKILIDKSYLIIENDANSNLKNQLVNLKNNLPTNLDVENEFEKNLYKIISFLATMQIYFKNLVKSTNYARQEYVTIYWDIVTLKGKFKSLI